MITVNDKQYKDALDYVRSISTVLDKIDAIDDYEKLDYARDNWNNVQDKLPEAMSWCIAYVVGKGLVVCYYNDLYIRWEAAVNLEEVNPSFWIPINYDKIQGVLASDCVLYCGFPESKIYENEIGRFVRLDPEDEYEFVMKDSPYLKNKNKGTLPLNYKFTYKYSHIIELFGKDATKNFIIIKYIGNG